MTASLRLRFPLALVAIAVALVVECRRMFGLPDYLIRVAVSGPADYESFYMNKLAELPGLARVNSQFTMKAVKRDRGVPF